MGLNINDFYKGKRVFVTGHTGFKGSWLLCWLQELGCTIMGYALSPEQDDCLFNAVKSQLVFDNHFGNILDKKQLQTAIQDFQPDIVFHLAAQALVRKSYAVPSDTFDVNVVGTANVLESIIQLPKKCTVVIITTDKVYENKEINYHYKEEDTLGGYDPYSASKAAAEIVVNAFRNSFFNKSTYHQHQKIIVSARAGNVIGGGDWSKDRIVPDIIQALENEAPIHVRNPNAVRPWQHVLEPLSGYLQLGMQGFIEPSTISNAYNFGPLADDHLPVKKLVEIAIACWGNGQWEDTSDANQPHEAGLLQLDIEKARKELNWQPQLNSSEAIAWTVDWYKSKRDGQFELTMQQIKNYSQK